MDFRKLSVFNFSHIMISVLTAFFLLPTQYTKAHQSSPSGGSESLLWGKWKYIGFIYKGHFQKRPNPNLILTFEFLKDGNDILRWSYLNEKGFCERKGEYSYNGTHLTDKIIWVNPENAIGCQKDPDMIKDRIQITPVRRLKDRLHLEIPLSDEAFIYVLTLVE